MRNDAYFFAQDQDCHWYLVPERLRADWEAATRNDLEEDEEINAFINKYSRFMLNTGVSQYVVYNPILRKALDVCNRA